MHDKEPASTISQEDAAAMRARIAELEGWRAAITLRSPRTAGAYDAFWAMLDNDVDALAAGVDEIKQPVRADNAVVEPVAVNALHVARLETWANNITFAEPATIERYTRLLELLRDEAGEQVKPRVAGIGGAAVRQELESESQASEIDKTAIRFDEATSQLEEAESSAQLDEALAKYGLTGQDLYHSATYLFQRQEAEDLKKAFEYRGITPLSQEAVESLEVYRPGPLKAGLPEAGLSSMARRQQLLSRRQKAMMTLLHLIETPQKFPDFMREVPLGAGLPTDEFLDFLKQFRDDVMSRQLSSLLNDLSRYNPANEYKFKKRKI